MKVVKGASPPPSNRSSSYSEGLGNSGPSPLTPQPSSSTPATSTPSSSSSSSSPSAPARRPSPPPPAAHLKPGSPIKAAVAPGDGIVAAAESMERPPAPFAPHQRPQSSSAPQGRTPLTQGAYTSASPGSRLFMTDSSSSCCRPGERARASLAQACRASRCPQADPSTTHSFALFFSLLSSFLFLFRVECREEKRRVGSGRTRGRASCCCRSRAAPRAYSPSGKTRALASPSPLRSPPKQFCCFNCTLY
jgi:hypothetical protein